MATAGPTASTPTAARDIEAGALLIGLGALLLLVSLFLDWYQPGLEAWTVFEVWDLVLALLAVGALVAVAGRMGFGVARPPSWLLGIALAVLVIVVYAILDPPPSIAGIPDGDPTTGLWLALAAAVLMTLGAVLSVTRISVAITAARRDQRPAGRTLTDEPGGAAAPRRGARFTRGGATPAADEDDEFAPEPGPGRRDPTEPTRRL